MVIMIVGLSATQRHLLMRGFRLGLLGKIRSVLDLEVVRTFVDIEE
jgi:hypothetical protein